MANSLAINRNFTEALRYLNQTLPVRGSVKDGNIRDDGLNTAATLYNQLGQYQLGLSYAMEMLSGDPAPRARCNASFLRAAARFHLMLLSAYYPSIAPVVVFFASLVESTSPVLPLVSSSFLSLCSLSSPFLFFTLFF